MLIALVIGWMVVFVHRFSAGELLASCAFLSVGALVGLIFGIPDFRTTSRPTYHQVEKYPTQAIVDYAPAPILSRCRNG